MLKSFIQLFAETFLKGRYKDIAFQVRGKDASQIAIAITDTSEWRYTAPSSGYVTLRVSSSENTWFRIDNESTGMSYLTNNNGTWKFATLSVKKGDTIVFGLSPETNVSATSCWFIPCVCES